VKAKAFGVDYTGRAGAQGEESAPIDAAGCTSQLPIAERVLPGAVKRVASSSLKYEQRLQRLNTRNVARCENAPRVEA
jgi:hypothetical protein